MKKITDLVIETKKIEWQNIKDLQPINLKNEFHSGKVRESIINNGFSRAIYVWKNGDETLCIDGHMRMDVLRELMVDGFDIPKKLSCTFLKIKNRKQAMKILLETFNAKTNTINEGVLLDWGVDEGFDFEDLDIKFEGLHLDFGEESAHEEDTEGDDDTPDIPEEPKTVRGDLYELGEHRVLCGDSTVITDIDRLMGGIKADMVLTDPPYGINYQSNGRSKKFDILKNDDKIITGWIPFIQKINSGFIFIWTSWKVIDKWILATTELGYPSNMIIWNKGGGGLGDLQNTFASDYEIALVWNNENEIKGKRIGSVWDIGKDSGSNYKHPTQKPVGLPEQAIISTTKKRGVVLDLFLGSGSTLVACEKTSRKCYGMELDEKYCDVIVRRYIDFCKKNNKTYTVKRNGSKCDDFDS